MHFFLKNFVEKKITISQSFEQLSRFFKQLKNILADLYLTIYPYLKEIRFEWGVAFLFENFSAFIVFM